MASAVPKALPAGDGRRYQRFGRLDPALPLLIVPERVLEAIGQVQPADGPSVRIGGTLAGRLFVDDRFDPPLEYVRLDGLISGMPGGVSRQGSFVFTMQAWTAMRDALEARYPDAMFVGWYITHPGQGLEVSDTEEFIQQNFFSAPWNVLLVVDPAVGRFGFFRLVDGRIEEAGGFVETGENPAEDEALDIDLRSLADPQ